MVDRERKEKEEEKKRRRGGVEEKENTRVDMLRGEEKKRG